MNDEALYLKYAAEGLKNTAGWLMELSRLKDKPPTTDQPTRDNKWDAPAPASTGEQTPPSSQSARVGTESGPAEPRCACAPRVANWELMAWGPNEFETTHCTLRCKSCGVYESFARTPAPAAAPTSSTSQKQESTPSAPEQTSAQSRSSESIEHLPEQRVRLQRRKE